MSGLCFSFSEEQEMLRRSVHEFANREIKPHIKRFEEKREWPWEIWRKMADFGIQGLCFPEEYGGQFTDWVSVGIATEEIALAGGPYPAHVWGLLIANYGSEEQKQTWIPRIVKGETLVGVGSTEPRGGSDAANITTKAEKKGDKYVINGEKQFVSHIMESEAFVITARTGPEPGHRGVSTILVELNRPGIEKYLFRTMGWWSHSFGGIRFSNVEVPVSNLVGIENNGFKQLMATFDVARVLLGLWAVGYAQASIDEAVEYAKQREAFGRPIAKFTNIQFDIAEAQTNIEAARLLCYRALWMRDKGMRHTKESAMAKYFALTKACDAIDKAIQIHGAIGITTELELERRYRDVRGIRIGDGTDEIMKLIIAREILGREYLPYR